ncbi:tripartite motif-containing protein 59-like [Penaeus chinensis]|uniref:tripartite motif-containing protein 59-like n=1 Tax=Penaeus chinensis TaxID=139456 RepID=UPI001FB6AA73|nr:tripartite motif-containing protein 59-like [Penaeus chinensis]XP_047497880.1 tripartite motif-containing protein 59-like [Penaeus chinensis]
MDCRVCYSNFDYGSHLPRNLQCGHAFCTSCLATLFRGKNISCPECRGNQNVQDGVRGLPVGHTVLRILAPKYCEGSNRAPLFVPPKLDTEITEAWSNTIYTGTRKACLEQILQNNLTHMSLLKRVMHHQQRVAQRLEEEAERCKQEQLTIVEVKEELLSCKKRLDEAQTQEDIEDPGTPLWPNFKSSGWCADQQRLLNNYVEVNVKTKGELKKYSARICRNNRHVMNISRYVQKYINGYNTDAISDVTFLFDDVTG